MIKFEITILGTSSALPTSKRYPTAQVLNVRERFFLIDCGEGTQMQLRKYAVKYSRINHIFISHLHGDHYFGLIGLLSTYVLLGRNSDLHIYSHSVLQDLLKMQLDYLGKDLKFKIIWHPLNFKKEQVIFENEFMTVSSFPLKHRISCCGFLFREKTHERNIRKDKIEKYSIPLCSIHKIKDGEDFVTESKQIIPNKELTLPLNKSRSYAFCTDTSFMPELKAIIEGVDLLYHEATYDQKMLKRAIETNHSTAYQAGTLAEMSNVHQLLLGHFSARYKDLSVLENEAKEVFENTQAAYEGMTLSLPLIRSKD